MAKGDMDPREYIEQRCRDLAIKVWNEALDRALEQVYQADNCCDAAYRVRELKIDIGVE